MPRSSHVVALVALIVTGAAACSLPSRHEQIRTSSADYLDPAMWLCRPDVAADACRIDLTTTELEADGRRVERTHRPAVGAPVDCFYVYPTVDLNLVPGNHVDFSDVARMRAVAAAQIARLSEVCNVYAPLYRQATIATYLSSKGDQHHIFDVAYSDIAAAFHAYLVHFDRGRPIVIVGHSQGSQMAARLIHDTFDQSDALRPRLLVAMLIGFSVDVPDGAATGGTFQELQACTRPDQTACVIAFRSIAEGDSPSGFGDLPAGHHAMCVSPSSHATLSETVVPAAHHELGVATPYISVRDLYRATCVAGPHGRDFLAIGEQRVAGDRRPSLIDLGKSHGGIGLHIYDMQFAQGDLIETIRTKLAAWTPTGATAR